MIDPTMICTRSCGCRQWYYEDALFLATRNENLANSLSFSFKAISWEVKKHPKAKRMVTPQANRVFKGKA